jgi:hypothetical protein
MRYDHLCTRHQHNSNDRKRLVAGFFRSQNTGYIAVFRYMKRRVWKDVIIVNDSKEIEMKTIFDRLERRLGDAQSTQLCSGLRTDNCWYGLVISKQLKVIFWIDGFTTKLQSTACLGAKPN